MRAPLQLALLAGAATRGLSFLFQRGVDWAGGISPLPPSEEGNLSGLGAPHQPCTTVRGDGAPAAPSAMGGSTDPSASQQPLYLDSDAGRRKFEGRLHCRNISGFECLQSYLQLPEPSFRWQDTGYRLTGADAITGVTWTGYVLNMTSLTWLNADVVAWPEWWHIVVVIVPGSVSFADFAIISMDFGLDSTFDSGLVFVENRGDASGTGMREDLPTLDLQVLELAIKEPVYIATHVGVVTAAVFQAPNELQVFASDPNRLLRYQDPLMAWARVDFCHNMDQPERMPELALMKVVAKAMDTLTSFAATSLRVNITRFGVAGFSKLGRASWMSVADPRVEAIAPTNLPLGIEGLTRETMKQPWTKGMTDPRAVLVEPFMGTVVPPPKINHTVFIGRMRRARRGAPPGSSLGMHGVQPNETGSGGNYASMLTLPSGNVYWDYLMRYCPSDAASVEQYDHTVRRLLEPLNYLEKLSRVNKLIVQGVNDNWFDLFLQDIKQWFPHVPGKKQLLVANSDHLRTWARAMPQVAAFFLGHLLGEKPPEADWWQSQSGTSWQIHAAVQAGGGRVPLAARLHFGTQRPLVGFVLSKFETQPASLVHHSDGNVSIVADVPIPEVSTSGGSRPLTRAFVDLTYEANAAGDAPMISSPIYEFP